MYNLHENEVTPTHDSIDKKLHGLLLSFNYLYFEKYNPKKSTKKKIPTTNIHTAANTAGA